MTPGSAVQVQIAFTDLEGRRCLKVLTRRLPRLATTAQERGEHLDLAVQATVGVQRAARLGLAGHGPSGYELLIGLKHVLETSKEGNKMDEEVYSFVAESQSLAQQLHRLQPGQVQLSDDAVRVSRSQQGLGLTCMAFMPGWSIGGYLLTEYVLRCDRCYRSCDT